MTVADPAGAVLLEDGRGAVLAGHVAEAGGPAHVAVLRTRGPVLAGVGGGSPAGWWSSPALDAGEPCHDAAGCATAAGVHHGVNRCGLLVACAPAGAVARSGLAGAVLARAAGVEEAAALLGSAAASLEGPDRVWLAGPGGGLRVELDGGGARRHPLPSPPPADDEGLDRLRAALRHRSTAGAVSAIAARLDTAGPALLVCLGPPAGGVFVRQWPGIPPPPPLTGDADRPPPLGSLAGALAAVPADDGIAAGLAAAEAQALAEGDEAERMARIMDAAGDDHGAEVRRVLAQAHAADLAATALERLLHSRRSFFDPTL
ncbi:MAG: hypothetical protein QOG45_692 [Chloroflexota bacterium]|nr:hypothetical protein [Chloroflexota bacterium]